MLKTKLYALAVAIPFALSSAPTQASDVESALANICSIVVADDKSELRKKIKGVRSSFRLQLKDYYTGIKCNGNSMIREAALNNAIEAGTLLVKKMPKKDLETPEEDGKTLQAWLTEQGLADNPIAVALQERI
ncbi:DUF3718 domain-containing protein [Brumicola nitratireducens]|uniref:DUF3718 domain-containing protein n=1 Tax=Glaciecola nitratireducens (strain JCM 12485 / KCTC 12276 / FR1064) TaxID=1085623 RepID=G4QGP0_GLANF|nr:DUF3718 domain-containing protein [Glaciecola nitratireducens]AEP29677.1 hypothetical protein GNIT_1559 [Glaciecola nitratireducens FR1064]